MPALPDQQYGYRCYGLMDRRGRWRTWRFAPRAEYARLAAEVAGAGQVLFASVQRFASPRNQTGTTWWRKVREQYTGEDALPHIAPLYFDIDCDGDLDRALVWVRELMTFFTDQLRLPGAAVRVWFSGSKGAHIMIDATALGIEPHATLTADMRAVALDLVTHLAAQGTATMKIDSNVYSLPRMLRLADQVNPKSGLYKVELSHTELQQCSTHQIITLANKPRGSLWSADDLPTQLIPSASQWWASVLTRVRQPRAFRIKTAQIAGLKVRPDGYVVDELTSTTMPSCIKGIFNANPMPGVRNRCELQIACWTKAAKLPYTKALVLLSAWTDRNRPELSADNAHRKAESIIRSVCGNSSYGFSCAAARAAARSVSFEPNCGDCRVVQHRQQRQVHSLRVRHDDQWSPCQRISLEPSRGLIARAIDQRVMLTRSGESRDSTTGGPDNWTIRSQQYDDERWQAVWRHVVTGELMQAVGRLRPLTNDATIYIVTNEPLPDWLEVNAVYAAELFDAMATSTRRNDFQDRVGRYARTMKDLESAGVKPSNRAVCAKLGIKECNGFRYRKLAQLLPRPP